MGGESSKMESLFRALDSDRDGYLTAEDLHQWICDEHMLANPLFDPLLNGMRNPRELADAFLKFLDGDGDGRASKADLVAFCSNLGADDMAELACSFVASDAAAIASVTAAANGSAASTLSLPPTGRARANSAADASTALLTAVSPGVLILAQSRRERLLTRIFAALDSNGNGTLERAEVDAWMEAEARLVSQLARDRQAGAPSQLDPGMQYFLTASQRAEVWKTLNTRPVERPAPQANSTPGTPNPAASAPAGAGAAAAPSHGPLHHAQSSSSVLNPSMRKQQGTLSALANFSPWSSSRVITMPDRSSAHQQSFSGGGSASSAATTPALGPPQPAMAVTSAPVRIEEVRRFFSRWSVRELRAHFADRVSEAEERAKRRMARAAAGNADASSPDAPSPPSSSDSVPKFDVATSPSLGGAELDAEVAAASRASSLLQQALSPYLPSPLTPEVSALLQGLSSATEKLEELSRESLRKARENLEVNACKRQLNAEIAAIEGELLALDQTRLVLCNSTNDAQNDWNLLANKEREAKRRVEVAATKLAATITRYEDSISSISSLQSELEKAKVTSKVLADELVYLSNLDKNFPAHRKQLQAQIEKHESMTAASESALADVRKVKASYEAEMAAIENKIREEREKREEKEREREKEDAAAAAATTSPAGAEASTATSGSSSATSADSSAAAGARRASTSDAASTAGASASLSSLSTAPRSRSSSVSISSNGSDAGSSSQGGGGVVSQVKGIAAGTLGSISSLLPSALTRPLEAVSSAVSSALTPSQPPAPASATSAGPAAPAVVPVPDSPFLVMRARMASKLKEITRQEFEALSHLATIRDVLIHLRAQLRQEQDQMRDPASVTERIRVVKDELEAKKLAVVALNARQVALQRNLSGIDAERKNAHEEQRAHERAVAALQSRMQSLTFMINKGETSMESFGARKDALTDQMRLKLSTQQIVAQQQHESVLQGLAELNERFAHTLAVLSHKHSRLEAALEAHLRRTEYAARRAKMAELGIELAETEGEGPHIQAPDVLDPLTGLMRPATSSPTSPTRSTVGSAHPATAPASTTAPASFTFDRVGVPHKSAVPLHLQSTQQRQLHELFAAGHANPLMSLALAYRSAPFPCVSYVAIEVQLPPPINSSFVMLTSNGSGGGSSSGGSDLPALPPLPGSDVCVSHGVLRIAHNTMLYDRDVSACHATGDEQLPPASGPASVSVSAAGDNGSSSGGALDPELVALQPALQSLSRFCIDITRDVLDAYYLDRYGHREDRLDEEDEDEDSADEDEAEEKGKGQGEEEEKENKKKKEKQSKQAKETVAAAAAATASSDVPALPADPDADALAGPARESMSPKASASGPALSASPPPSDAVTAGATSSLLLSFRPGYRNRFLFNVDTNEPASTAPHTSSVLSLSLGGGGGSGGGSSASAAGAAGAGASSTPGEALRALTGSSLTGAGSDGPKHLVKLTADTRTVRRIYNTLHVYLEKRRAAERAAATRAAEAAKAKNLPPVASAASTAPGAGSSTASGRVAGPRRMPPAAGSSSMYQRDTSVFIEGTSDLVHDSHLRTLVKAAPSRHSLNVWGLVYSMARHGVSRSRFFDVLAEVPCAIIIFKDMKGAVFGGFASQAFIPAVSRGYYGSGECYVFKIHQPSADSVATVGLGGSPSGSVQVFRWRGNDEYYMITGDAMIAMGGGGAYAWQVDDVFRYGTSGPCSTYESPILASGKNFELNEMEAPIKEAAEMVTENLGSTLYPRPK